MTISDKSLDEFIALSEKEGIKYKTRAEAAESANNLIGLCDILIQMGLEEDGRKKRLEQEPKGFILEGKGRNCSLCGRGVYEGDGWYDKWGFKCMNCQKAVDKKNIPGSLCGDYDHKKCITDTSLSYKTGLHVQTIRKLIRQGKIKARQIPNGPFMILRKDNPDILAVIDAQKAVNTK